MEHTQHTFHSSPPHSPFSNLLAAAAAADSPQSHTTESAIEADSPQSIQSSTNNNSSSSSNIHLNGGNTKLPSQKRQKVSLACQECRDRKIKCDGQRPSCGPCIKKKRPQGMCVYEPERGRRGVKSQYVQLLEHKIKELENAMRPMNTASSNGTFPNIPIRPASSSSESIKPATTVEPVKLHNPRHVPLASSNEVDAMGASAGRNTGYFGSSSAMSFMHEVHQVIGKKASLLGRQGNSSNEAIYPDLLPPQQRSPRSYTQIHDYVLPPRKVADALVQSYWTFVHTLYPFLHKPSFMRTYGRLWGEVSERETLAAGYNADNSRNNDDDDEEPEANPLFQCILNLVFALGCQLSPEMSEEEREPTSDIFFQRSKKLLHFDILDEGNIKVVQALLLMGQYLQCTTMPGRCWIVVGLATRVAQGLGLHLEHHPSRRNRSPLPTSKNGHHHSPAAQQLEKEMNKRLWCGCIVLDRVISMAYGRPFMIPVTKDLDLPQAIDDELLTSNLDPPAEQPADKPSEMAFFVHTIQLYEIMGEILTTLYSIGTMRRHTNNQYFNYSYGTAATHRYSKDLVDGGVGEDRVSKINSIMRLESALSAWEQGLPWFLRLDTYTRDSARYPDRTLSNCLLRQNNVLRARYLHTCILLYRPVFAYYFASEESNHPTTDDTQLQKSLFLQCSITCVGSAQELVEMIHRNIKEVLPAWWYNIFYLYTSATVLLMARLFPRIKQSVGEDYLIESWQKCLACLAEYRSYSASAKWCYESLSELDKRAFQSNQDPADHHGMSSIQILGTLPGYHGGSGHDDNPQNNNHFSLTEDPLDLDLQDMSWLGRLPVYTDLEPGPQLSHRWLGRLYTDVNTLL